MSERRSPHRSCVRHGAGGATESGIQTVRGSSPDSRQRWKTISINWGDVWGHCLGLDYLQAKSDTHAQLHESTCRAHGQEDGSDGKEKGRSSSQVLRDQRFQVWLVQGHRRLQLRLPGHVAHTTTTRTDPTRVSTFDGFQLRTQRLELRSIPATGCPEAHRRAVQRKMGEGWFHLPSTGQTEWGWGGPDVKGYKIFG